MGKEGLSDLHQNTAELRPWSGVTVLCSVGTNSGTGGIDQALLSPVVSPTSLHCEAEDTELSMDEHKSWCDFL